MRVRDVIAGGGAALLLAGSAEARPRASLDVTSAPAGCPEGRALRSAVAERLGYDPFDGRASTVLRVSIARAPSAQGDATWRGTVRVERDGREAGERVVTSNAPTCDELAGALALSVALVIDPLAGARPGPAPEQPVEDPFKAPPPPVARPAEPAEATRLRFGVGVHLSFAALPAPTFGAHVLVGVERARLGVDLEGRVDVPSNAEGPAGSRVRASLLVATIAPCVRFGWLRPCLLAAVGGLSGEGADVARARRLTALYAAIGARLAAELPVTDVVLFRATIDALAPLTPTTLGVGDVDVWRTPPVQVVLGSSLVARFP